jgi:Animal haem peroxidase
MAHGINQRDITQSGGAFNRLFRKRSVKLFTDSALKALAATMVTEDAVGSDNPNVPSGYTYFGQFIDHDITFDPTTINEKQIDPGALENFRSPALDLDSVYGAGPVGSPFMFGRGTESAKAQFTIGTTSSSPGGGNGVIPVSMPFDLPRSTAGFALIPDPRNDENIVIAQMHLLMLRFHNSVVTKLADGTLQPITLAGDAVGGAPLFEQARRIVVWHYQWLVLNDFLRRRVVDSVVLDSVINDGAKIYKNKRFAYIPVEFSVAAYRLGHSMVRDVYDYNFVFRQGGVTPASLALLFQFTGRSGANVPIPSDWIIDWRRFFNVDATIVPQPARSYDPFLAKTLANLPMGGGSLAERNLIRSARLNIPSAQSILNSLSATLGIVPLTEQQLTGGPDGAVLKAQGLHTVTPLWYYILKEALISKGGLTLGALGSRLVSEVLVELLRRDKSSFLSVQPTWQPTIPTFGANFEFADLVRFVGDPNPISATVGNG